MKEKVFSGVAPPPFLLGAVVLFWGWQNALLVFAIPMALALESPRYVKIRLEFSDTDFKHLADFTSVLWLLVAVYLFFQYSVHGLFRLFKLLPLLFFLLVLGQRFSSAGNMRLSSLFISMRRAEKQALGQTYFKHLFQQRVDISYPYILMALLSASVARQPGFFIGLVVFCAWALWFLRPRRYPAWLWALLFSLAVGAGFAGQSGLRTLQNQVERWLLTWFEYRMWRFRDPYQQQTAIGDIGELKQSERVLLRVEADAPLLLREASYITYFNGIWRTPRPHHFKGFVFPEDERHWELADAPASGGQSARISLYPRAGKIMLPVPSGTYALHLPPGPDVQGSAYGALKVTEAPGMLKYKAYYSETTPLDRAPDATDLELPADEAGYLRAKAQELGLPGLSARAASARLSTFFDENFSYSLNLGGRGNTPPLQTFLEQTRAGHCEYFATAGTLLLRAAGIPARYAAGYAVQEYSALQNVYLVRRRHAHAWILVYDQGRWHDLDTTPAVWTEIEAAQAPWWQTLYDSSAWLYYAFAYLRWAEADDEGDKQAQILWLILPLLVLLLWRLSRQRRINSRSDTVAITITRQGLDSAFFRIVDVLQARYPRQSSETLATWLERIKANGEVDTHALENLLYLHNRYRFDPHGLSAAEQEYFFKTCHSLFRAYD
jgi:protein-glutamine gamma-glutamyltransferase